MSESGHDEYKHASKDTDQSPEPLRTAGRTLKEFPACAQVHACAADPSSNGEDLFRGDSESFVQGTEETGRFLQPAELAGLIDESDFPEDQIDGKKRFGQVFEMTKSPCFGLNWRLKGYVKTRIRRHNIVDDGIRLEGVTPPFDGLSPSLPLPFIIGQKPSGGELAEWFDAQGCEKLSGLRWKYPDGTIMGDAHSRNLIVTPYGTIIPTDFHTEPPGPKARPE